MNTKTFASIVKNIGNDLNGVCHHPPTETNEIGQSGLHTVCDDIIDIVVNSDDEAHAYKLLHKYFLEGSVEIKG